MKHEEAKKKLLENPEVKREYDELEYLYEIKEQIIKIRNEKGLSQKELAEILGTKQSAISRLENDMYNPTVEFLNKIAKACDKELEINFK
ncbi:helix-turn-helix transcriptional regulator [Natranaerofaba carboxydovora]|uniref:helix-turn-helix transcriptional regulator n=1 Tax=Natranaerofaba carboxydovora TaxID=2742683 RepID=UPI001F12E9EB|nr:helix-turn-helix transcriptional regulator [Natranaerofaba carboxydovora]UMZ74746.1 helix-turn-helix protein [Natranaerofaba carboxydovora]